MKITLIVAMDKNRVIGNNNRMPWKLSSDLKRFKELTMGKPIVMGRKTFDSIGRPLPGRTNFILTRNKDLKIEGCKVINSMKELLLKCEVFDELMVIGGSKIYEQFIDKSQKIFLTMVEGDFEGDVFFPKINLNEWKEIMSAKYLKDEKNDHDYVFKVLERKN